MNKKICIFLLTILICMSFSTVSFASSYEKTEDSIGLRWSILSSVFQNFDITSGNATIEALTIANSYATQASVTVNLQRKTGTNSWTTIKSWTVSENDYRASFAINWLVLTGYYYRLETVHSASYGGQNETTVLVSAERYAM